MIVRIFDKLTFAVALIIALQVPQLTDHYQQHLAGLYQATKWQVDGYKATAQMHAFPSVKAMIDRHLRNSEPSVKTDAQQKLLTLDLFADLEGGMTIFKQGNFFEKLIYMFTPTRFGILKNTIDNFKLGIPLTFTGIAFGLVFGFLLNQLIMLPFTIYSVKKRASKVNTIEKPGQ